MPAAYVSQRTSRQLCSVRDEVGTPRLPLEDEVEMQLHSTSTTLFLDPPFTSTLNTTQFAYILHQSSPQIRVDFLVVGKHKPYADVDGEASLKAELSGEKFWSKISTLKNQMQSIQALFLVFLPFPRSSFRHGPRKMATTSLQATS